MLKLKFDALRTTGILAPEAESVSALARGRKGGEGTARGFDEAVGIAHNVQWTVCQTRFLRRWPFRMNSSSGWALYVFWLLWSGRWVPNTLIGKAWQWAPAAQAFVLSEARDEATVSKLR